MIVVVSGTRSWRYPDFVRLVLNASYVKWGVFVLYHGDCRDRQGRLQGADRHADEWGRGTPGIDVRPHPADWDRHGKAAGPIRNREMIKEALAEAGSLDKIRFAGFQQNSSRGTQNAYDTAMAFNIPAQLWTEADAMAYRKRVRNDPTRPTV